MTNYSIKSRSSELPFCVYIRKTLMGSNVVRLGRDVLFGFCRRKSVEQHTSPVPE